MVFVPHFVIPLYRYTVITSFLKMILWGEMGYLGNLGLMGAEVSFFQRPLILFFLKHDSHFLLENATKYRHTKRKTCRQMLYLRSLL